MENDGLSCICEVQNFLNCAYNGSEIKEETLNTLFKMKKEDLISYMFFIATQLKLTEELTDEEKRRIISMEEINLNLIENYFQNEALKQKEKVLEIKKVI